MSVVLPSDSFENMEAITLPSTILVHKTRIESNKHVVALRFVVDVIHSVCSLMSKDKSPNYESFLKDNLLSLEHPNLCGIEGITIIDKEVYIVYNKWPDSTTALSSRITKVLPIH